MKSANPKFGLVLTGGGAKGAYQAGALKYLAEVGFRPDIIAGSSIGALNSAILASHCSFSYATQRLDEFWTELSFLKPLKVNFGTVAKYATSFFSPTLFSILELLALWKILPDSTEFLDPLPIENLVKHTIDPSELRHGIELWVTVFPCIKVLGIELDTMVDLVRAVTASEAHWICAQDIEEDEAIHNLLLASAALPWVFPRRKVEGTNYIDGGLADNVPLKPLAQRGCNYVIVIHLQNGSVWDRQLFPEQTVVEIRPQLPINKSDFPVVGMLETFSDWSYERISHLKQRGYEDAEYCLAPILETLTGVYDLRKSTSSVLGSTYRLIKDQPLIDP